MTWQAWLFLIAWLGTLFSSLIYWNRMRTWRWVCRAADRGWQAAEDDLARVSAQASATMASLHNEYRRRMADQEHRIDQFLEHLVEVALKQDAPAHSYMCVVEISDTEIAQEPPNSLLDRRGMIARSVSRIVQRRIAEELRA